jgi:hypothetical protein
LSQIDPISWPCLMCSSLFVMLGTIVSPSSQLSCIGFLHASQLMHVYLCWKSFFSLGFKKFLHFICVLGKSTWRVHCKTTNMFFFPLVFKIFYTSFVFLKNLHEGYIVKLLICFFCLVKWKTWRGCLLTFLTKRFNAIAKTWYHFKELHSMELQR